MCEEVSREPKTRIRKRVLRTARDFESEPYNPGDRAAQALVAWQLSIARA